MQEQDDADKDLEDGELGSEALQEMKPRVPSPPPSPPKKDPPEQSSLGNKKSRKQLEKAIAAGKPVERGFLRAVYGDQAKPALVLAQPLKPIRPPDIQALLLWCLADRKEGKNPAWAFVRNVPLIQQVVLLFVPAISSKLFRTRQDLMPNMAQLGPAVPVLSKDGLIRPAYTVSMLLKVPFSKEKRQFMSQTGAELENKAGKGPLPFPPSHYVLKPDMMERMKYPLPKQEAGGPVQLPDGFIQTQPAQGQKAQGEDVDGEAQLQALLALDCEMCETLPGLFELTRISVVDGNGKVVYDQLVLPSNPISNYLTDKSGITAALMEGVTTNLEEVQARFLQLVSADTILVGHALENDLRAIKVVHMRCIDTGALFPHPKGLPYRSALRRLADKFLKRKIQDGQHDSVIDATTALDLAKLKFKHGPAFGLTSQNDFGEPLAEVLMRGNKACTMVDRADTLHKFLTGCADGITCNSDQEVAERVSKAAGKAAPANGRGRFVWGQLRELSDFYEGRVSARRQEAAAQRARAEVEVEGAKPQAHSTPADAAANGKEQHLSGSKRGREEAIGPDIEQPSKKQHVEGTGSTIPPDPPAPVDGDGLNGEADPEGSSATMDAPTIEVEEGEQEDSAEERAIREADRHVGRVYSALLQDSLLVVCSCLGDTAGTRYLYEEKLRRSQGVEAPPWTKEDEKRYVTEFAKVSMEGICLAAIKS